MLTSLDVTHPLYENIRSIERCVQSGANLTRQLLGYARGGKYIVKPNSPNQIVQKTAELFERTKKQIRIVQDYHKDIWTVSVDRNQIEQVLYKLVSQCMAGHETGRYTLSENRKRESR